MPGSAAMGVAVLLGGGVESTLLVRRELAAGHVVVPVHVDCGLLWDACETRWVRRFCEASAGSLLQPLVEIRLPLAGFLGNHWAVTGRGVPRGSAPAADLEIPLRNLTLLAFAVHRLPGGSDLRLAVGTTAENCYRDGSRGYFDQCERLLAIEAGRPVRVLTPLIELTKAEVIRASDAQTLALSFSCVDPRGDLHCGACIKCARRQAAFRAAGVPDPTVYATLN